MTTPTDLLTIPQVAEMLHLSRSGVYNLLAAGHIEAVTIGKGSRRIVAESVREYVERLREGQR